MADNVAVFFPSSAKTLRWAQRWVRKQYVQPFPHTCTYCHTPTRSIIHNSGCCIPTSGISTMEFIVKITRAESNPDVGLATQRVCFGPNVLARANEMPITTMPIPSDQVPQTIVINIHQSCGNHVISEYPLPSPPHHLTLLALCPE